MLYIVGSIKTQRIKDPLLSEWESDFVATTTQKFTCPSVAS